MSDSPLSVAFLWHMHQPYYRDRSGLYRLPWVRLHAVKDYLDMVEILDEFPSLRQTFNLVPSLIEQLDDYAAGTGTDMYLEATLKEASALSDKDKAFVLENFFFANWETMIRPLPRYYGLLKLRGFTLTPADIERAMRYFSVKDYRDLQVLFNLAWIDPVFRQRDKELGELIRKGEGYTEEDKRLVIGKQFDIIRRIAPAYKRLRDAGRIEISTSPFYHPILPLLCDTDSAKEALPGIRLPKKRFYHPEDARAQVRTALDFFEERFGHRPAGMWPSEGSVSETVLGMFKEEGIRWTATDEDVLAASLKRPLRDGSGRVIEPRALYSAYRLSDVYIFFRDRKLSDLIGFVYSGWDPKDAARDLLNHLLAIGSKGRIAPVILDGENAWEHYKNDGRDFLFYFYEGLSKEERLRTVTFSQHLDEHPEALPLERLHAGSWIYANFRTWIGHEEDNLSWDYLKTARDAVSEFAKLNPSKDLSRAWRSIYIAEGSDWNWWYGDEHVSENQKDFDELYRGNLLGAYGEIGMEPPMSLHMPILIEDRAVLPKALIRGFISPKIDGLLTGYFEWYQAASIEVGKTGGSMHRAESLVSEIRYGFDLHNLHVRVDPKMPFRDFPEGSVVSIRFLKPAEMKLDIDIAGRVPAALYEKSDDGWAKTAEVPAAVNEILEASVPFGLIKAEVGDEVDFTVVVCRGKEEIERCPWRGYVSLTAPSADFEAMMWY